MDLMQLWELVADLCTAVASSCGAGLKSAGGPLGRKDGQEVESEDRLNLM